MRDGIGVAVCQSAAGFRTRHEQCPSTGLSTIPTADLCPIGSAPTLTAGAVVLRAAALVAAGAVVLVVMLGLGWLVTHVEPQTPLGAADLGINGWFGGEEAGRHRMTADRAGGPEACVHAVDRGFAQQRDA